MIMLLALAGLTHAARATWAYTLVRTANFGAARDDADLALALAHRAHRKYPYSYYQAISAAVTAWEQYWRAADEGEHDTAEHYLKAVRYWTRAGLHLNPYPIQLRWLHTRLLEIDDSIDSAIAYWGKHTDWHYWYAYNHAVLADLYTRAGRFKDAERTLRMLRRSPFHADAAAALETARAEAQALGENRPHDAERARSAGGGSLEPNAKLDKQ